MNARAVISEVIERGISLSLNGGNLTVKAATKPPDDLLARIKAHKNNIVAILERDAAIAAPEPGQAAAIVSSDAKAGLEERKGLPMGSAPQSKPAAAPWPEPAINGTPPFGSDEVPGRYEAEWKALLARCPPWAPEWQWTAAIFDCRTLSGGYF